MENVSESADNGPSPCVRAFVANFERRDSNLGGGNENRPPVMTKSKVALLRQTLGKTSDSSKSTLSDSESGFRIHEAGDSDGTSDGGSEHIVSVAKLKENLKKSASEKPMAPWAFGGAGRPVKEPRKPTPKHRPDKGTEVEAKSAKIDIPPIASERPKRKLNNSFKQSQQNLIESPVRTESLDESMFFGNAISVSGVSNESESLPYQFNRSISGEYQPGEKHKLAPKVLPKPVPRKSKVKEVSVSHERSLSDDKCERTAYQNKNVTLEKSSGKPERNGTPLGNSASSSQSDTPGEVFKRGSGDEVICTEEHANHLRQTEQRENSSANVAGKEVHDSSDEPCDVYVPHAETNPQDSDVYRADTLNKLHTDDRSEKEYEDLVLSTNAGYSVPPVAKATRSSDAIVDENSDDDDYDEEKVAKAMISKRSDSKENDENSLSDQCLSSEVVTVPQSNRPSSSISSERTTDLVISDEEPTVDDNRGSKTEESIIPSREDRRSESPDTDDMHRTDSISLVQDSTRAHNCTPEIGNTIESASNSECEESTANSRFLHCMGPDFITDMKELSSMTLEEEEYEALAAIVCCKMLEQEEESVSWWLCPPETYRSTLDYVGSLFKDDILVDIGERRFGRWAIEESTFMSSDSLRETLLDKATKKLERLKVQKQRLEAAAAKQFELEELVDAVVKENVDSRQYSKYRSALEEFDQVTHLLLMLSSRLANTDNALDQISFSDDEHQKVQLISKRDNLIEKFKEAESIKESSETRRSQLAACLKQRLESTEFLDYRQLLKTRCQLKIVRQSLEDRISLSEEQVKLLVAIIEKNTSARYC